MSPLLDLDTDLVMDQISYARQVLRAEAEALEEVADRLDGSFDRIIEILFNCAGRIAVTGVGKSADVAQKIVGTFNSTGTRSYFLDATRALHGDLGMIHPNDVVVLISNSGESEEIVRLLTPLKKLAASVIGITGNKASRLALMADAALVYGPIVESSPDALAPSTSCTVAMSLGHALAFVLAERRQFTRDDFARYHPAGSLGFKLATVAEYMRSGTELRLAKTTDTVREVFAKARHFGRRTGAVMLLDEQGKLAGLFTDSDLARLFEKRADHLFDAPVSEIMTRMPLTIGPNARMAEAIEIMRNHKISELPVVEEDGTICGLLDITDLIGVEMVDPKNGLGLESHVRLFNRISA